MTPFTIEKLNLGCGPHAMAGWKNYDIESHPGVIRCDLKQVLPAPTNSAHFVYSEHFIEHVNDVDGIKLFTEIHRVLRPQGVFRVSTPDLRILTQDYLNNKTDRWKESWYPVSKCQLVNQGMRLWGHLFLYDFEELSYALETAGFEDIKRVKWHESEYPALQNLEIRPFKEDLIVEAIKGR